MDPSQAAIQPETAWGTLATYDGATITIVALTADGVEAAAESMEFLSELTAVPGREVSTDDATAYVRPTAIAAWTIAGAVGERKGTLGFAEGEEPEADLTGAPSVAGWAFVSAGGSDAARKILSVNRFPETGGGPGFAVSAPDGFATAQAEPTSLTTRLEAVEGRTVAGVAATEGDVPAEDLAGALEPYLPGGGGAGTDTDLTVEATAPALKSASTVAYYQAGADFVGVDPTIKAATSGFLPYLVTDTGDDQKGINDNTSALAGYALVIADLARTKVGDAEAKATAELGALAYGAGSPGGTFTSPDPYLLVGAGTTPDGYQENCFRMPAVAATFDDGIDVVIDAVIIDDCGIDGVRECGTHGRLDIDFDRLEAALRSVGGLVSFFLEYGRVGDPEVAGGEYAPGRIYSEDADPPVLGRVGDRLKGRFTVQADDGSGHGVVRLWIPTKGVPDETARGEAWRIVQEIVLDEPTSVSVVSDYWYCGFGDGVFGVFESSFYEYGGGFSHRFHPDDLQLDGTLLDSNGNVATPLGDATVVQPTLPGGGATEAYVDDAVAAATTAIISGAPGALDTLDELAAAIADDPTFATTVTTALSGKQGSDADLTAIAALATASYGRSLLELVNAAAGRTALGLGTGAVLDSDTDATLAAASDSKVATQKATKSYVDARFPIHRSATTSRRISTKGSFNTGAAEGMTTTGDRVYAPIFLPAGTYNTLSVRSTTAGTSTWRLGIFNGASGDPTRPGTVLKDAGTINLSVTAAMLTLSSLNFTIPADGWYWCCAQVETYTSAPQLVCAYGDSKTDLLFPGWPGQEGSYLRTYCGYQDLSPSAGALTTANAITGNASTGLDYAGNVPRFWVGP